MVATDSRSLRVVGVFIFVGVWTSALTCLAQVPADVGQVWKTYDIGPFVKQAGAGSEKHVVDWVLQETGYAAWHGASPASLSATPEKLSCFHTPEMQRGSRRSWGDSWPMPTRLTVSACGC